MLVQGALLLESLAQGLIGRLGLDEDAAADAFGHVKALTKGRPEAGWDNHPPLVIHTVIGFALKNHPSSTQHPLHTTLGTIIRHGGVFVKRIFASD